MSLRHIPIASSVVLSSVAVLAVLGFSGEARADHLDACGGLWLEVDAASRCEVVTKESCEQQCEPASVERVCASRLYEMCAPECSFTAEVECTSSCEETCGQQCSSSASVECSAFCMTDCQQTVANACDGDASHGECGSSGSECCSEHCEAQCSASTETECTPVCTTACTGSCEGRANIDCQVECQQSQYTVCTDQVVQECHEECETTGAAIFCDGHFLATGGDLKGCANAIADEFGIEIDVDIDVDIDGEDCEDIEDEVNEIDEAISCAVDPGASAPLGLLVLFAIGGWRIRRAARA